MKRKRASPRNSYYVCFEVKLQDNSLKTVQVNCIEINKDRAARLGKKFVKNKYPKYKKMKLLYSRISSRQHRTKQ